MAKSSSYRDWATIFAVLGSILLFVSLFGGWCQFNDYTTPDNVSGFRGKSTFGLWQFCADGTRTGLPYNGTTSGTATFAGCTWYGASYHATLPVCGQCLIGTCCTTTNVPVLKLPDAPGVMNAARSFAVIAALTAASVGCANKHVDDDDYQEYHGHGMSSLAIVSVVSGIISTACYSSFTGNSWWFYTQAIDSYENFMYDWGYMVFVAGWVFMMLCCALQVLGLKREAQEVLGPEGMDLKATV